MVKSLVVLLALLLSSLGVSLLAHGEEGKGTLQGEEVGEIVVSAEAVSLSTRVSKGESVLVIAREDFPPSASSLADVLERVPSARILRTGGEGSLATLSLRAAGANQVLFMLNGVPITLPGGTPADLSLFDLSSVERVEIATGLAYGGRAVSGIVNIITREKVSEVKAPSVTSLSSSVGSFSTYKAKMTYEKNLPSSHALILSSFFSTAGDFTFERRNGERLRRSNNEARRLNALYARESWRKSRLKSVSFTSAVLRRGVPGFAEFPTENAYLSEGVFVLSLHNLSGLDSPRQSQNRQWQKELNVSAVGSFIDFSDPKPALGAPIHSRTREFDIYSEWTLASSENEVLSTSLSFNKMLASSFGDPQRVSLRLMASKELSLGDILFVPNLVLNSADSLPLVLSGGLPIQWKLAKGVTVNAVLGRSFRYPEFSELYYPSQGFIRGNPDLRSERANFGEAGLSFKCGKFQAGVSFWKREHENQIKFVPISAYAISAVNTGRVDAKGIEATLEASPSPSLRFSLSESFTQADYENSKIELTQTPKYKLFATVDLEVSGWGIGVSHLRQSSQNADLFGSIRVPGKEFTSLQLGRHRKDETIRLSLNNLFNNPGRDFWDLPLPGRWFEFSYERRF